MKYEVDNGNNYYGEDNAIGNDDHNASVVCKIQNKNL